MGVIIAILVFLFWGGHLFYTLMYVNIDFTSPFFYLHLLVQTYLFTGLFITSHDSMHRTISGIKWVNNSIGFISLIFYAGMWYPRLLKNHHLHHKYPGTEKDPDYHVGSQNYWVWWFSFMIKYLTLAQLIIMAVFYNILKLWFSDAKLWIFWIMPAIFSTWQLFYFGTFLPHRLPHEQTMKPHNARTQSKNHLWAMVSCYFFGYHREHHEAPWVPWWKLYQTKTVPEK